MAFIIILAAASFLRLYRLHAVPPGLNQDEACNSWNGYCLLKTGLDQHGQPWPLLYSRGFGANRPALSFYLLFPFQLLGGLNVVTTRLPGAVCGVLTVLMVYAVASRMFDRSTGLVSMLFLAVNPWHLQLSRWGHAASVAPLLGLLPLAGLVAAGLVRGDGQDAKPRLVLAFLAGLTSGLCCYGYFSVRIFVPVLLLCIIVALLPGWRPLSTHRRQVLAMGLFLLGMAVFFGPLAWHHVFRPENISHYGQVQSLLVDAHQPVQSIIRVVTRFIRHFGLEFLFIRGAYSDVAGAPGTGYFHWHSLPLMLLGLAYALLRSTSSPAARVLLAYVIAYPTGDILFTTPGPGLHSLRSACGMPSLIILSAVGPVWVVKWLRRRHGVLMALCVGLFAVTLWTSNRRYLERYFGPFSRREDLYHAYHADLVTACKWLKPRLARADAVFVTTQGMNMPYAVTLVALGYPPQRWFSEPREFHTIACWDYYTRYGKMYFLYDDYQEGVLEELRSNEERDRVIFIVRPRELRLSDPVLAIVDPGGRESLWICERTL